MNEPLRPSTLGDILDRTAHLYRSRFLVFFGIAVVPTAVIVVFASAVFLLFAWSGVDKASDFANGILLFVLIAAGLFVVLPIFLAVSALASAAMNHAVARANLGETTTIREAYKAVWRRGWNYIGLYILEGLIIGVAPILVWVMLIFLSTALAALAQSTGLGAAGGVIFGLGAFAVFVALAAYVLYMLLRLSLSFPACVVEQIGALAALKRSSALTKGTRGRIFLLYLLGAVIGWMLTMVITVPLTILSALIPGMSSPEHAQTIGMILIFVIYGASFAIQSLTRPIYGIALVLFYYDQRIRQEGFDIEWMMLQAGLIAPTPPQPETAPWLPPVLPQEHSTEPPSPSTSAEPTPAEPTATEPAESRAEEPPDSSPSQPDVYSAPAPPPSVSEDQT
jgi:hypothetical protein